MSDTVHLHLVWQKSKDFYQGSFPKGEEKQKQLRLRRYVMKEQEKETFLKSRPQCDDFRHLLADQYLSETSDEGKIKRLKKAFGLAVKNHNDAAALKLLNLIGEAIYEKEDRIARGPQGDRHLGRASDQARKQLHDYLMKIYWQLPDMKRAATGQCPEDDEYHPTMLQTKFWILEEVIRDWESKTMIFPSSTTEESISAFRFLIAAYEPLPADWQTLAKNAEFKMQSKGRRTSQGEKDKILKLIRQHDTSFSPEELEEWMKQPWLPHEFERILAIARTRNGGQKLWRSDIRNAELLKPFSPDERTAAAIDLHKRHWQMIVMLDQIIVELLKRMKSGSWTKGEEIGGSEYVLGETKEVIYNNLFEIIISIEVGSEYSEDLVLDNFGRAKRHIEKWLKEHRSSKVILNMWGGEKDIKLNTESFGDRHYLTKK